VPHLSITLHIKLESVLRRTN